jgi:hypothetical protein
MKTQAGARIADATRPANALGTLQFNVTNMPLGAGGVFDQGLIFSLDFLEVMPPLFIVGADGNTSELVNYLVRNSHMIVDRLFAAQEDEAARGPEFKSRRSDQKFPDKSKALPRSPFPPFSQKAE